MYKFSPELKTAIEITKYLNKTLLKRFYAFDRQKIRLKKDDEIVTPADIEMNDYITKTLLKKFPAYDIVSEEAKMIDNSGKERWYVDPLDGTTNFAFGFPEFASCIGFIDGDNIIKAGVIGLPVQKQVFYAEKGEGAWCNGKKIHVSRILSLEKSMLLLCYGHSPSGRKRFRRLSNNLTAISTGHLRIFSSAGVELAAIAMGKADACIMADIHPWDVVAGVALIREAGGKVTNWQGKPWTPKDQAMVSSNGLIHDQIIKITKNIY